MLFNESKQPLKDMQAETQQLKDHVQQLTEKLDELKNRQTQMSASMMQSTRSFRELTANISNTETAIRKANDQIGANNKILTLSKGSLQQNRDLLERLNDEYEQMAATQGDNSVQAKALNTQIAFLNHTVTEQETKLEKSRKVFELQKESVKALGSAFDNIKDSNKDFGPVLGDVANGFNAMKNGLDHVQTGFKSVGGAIKTTGFGLLVLVLQSLVSYFTETTEGSKMLKGAIAAIGLVVDNVKKVFQIFGKTIVDAVSHPAETIKRIWGAVVDNITNRLKGIKVFFEGLFSGDLKKMGDGLIQMGTGITNGTDKIKRGFEQAKTMAKEAGKQIADAYEQGTKAADKAGKADEAAQQKATERRRREQEAIERHKKHKLAMHEADKAAEDERLASLARMSEAVLDDFAKQVNATNKHYEELKTKHKAHKATVEQLEKERVAALAAITKNFQDEQLRKLEDYEKQLIRLRIENITDAKKRALALLDQEGKEELAKYQENFDALNKIIDTNEKKLVKARDKKDIIEAQKLSDSIAKEQADLKTLEEWKLQYEINQQQKRKEINGQYAAKPMVEQAAPTNEVANQPENNHIAQLQQKMDMLKAIQTVEQLAGVESVEIHRKFSQQKLELDLQLTQSRLQLGDKFLTNVLNNSKKDSAIFKAAFTAKKATAIGDVIINTRQAVMSSLGAYAGIPFIGQALGIAQAAFMAAQGAASIAQIVKQKPGYAAGGYFTSDGRGALLPGYSRTDNTNAYLRSGEAVVVSEAMRNPWARNLVSAINVAYGGRDFSTAAATGAYALGGVFTDGGSAGRYYSQPVNDVKDLANTLAYQMINNFPPVYVDVKDINSQQSIMARTINRVNL